MKRRTGHNVGKYVELPCPLCATLPESPLFHKPGNVWFFNQSFGVFMAAFTHWARNTGSIPGFGRLPGERHRNSLQSSCLGNSMDRGAWWAIVHGVAKSQTLLLSDWTPTKQHNTGMVDEIIGHFTLQPLPRA